MDNNVDKILEKVSKIEVLLERTSTTLQIHLGRQEMLEQDFQKRIKPIEEHVTLMGGIIKIVIFIGVCVGIYNGLK
jgi:hypothetical protein